MAMCPPLGVLEQEHCRQLSAVQAWGSSSVLPWCVTSRPRSVGGKPSQQRDLTYFHERAKKKIPISPRVSERVLAGEQVLSVTTLP